MGESNGAVTRREALLTTAKVAGAAAFVAPVVIGVFSASSVSAAPVLCSAANDSDAVFGTIDSNTKKWNVNCGGNAANDPCAVTGNYNGQNTTFTLGPGSGTVQVGLGGVDNFCTSASYYVITNPAGYTCSATWAIENCNGAIGSSTPNLGAPSTAQSLPYCTTNCNGVKLVLSSVVCCPN